MANQEMALQQYLQKPNITLGLEKKLGNKAHALKSNLIQIVQNDKRLQDCEPRSIVGAAFCATVNGLSITPSLGQAYIVPFGKKATFQIGWKGLVQLAHRTGKYKTLHSGKVYEGEFKGFNPFTGEPERGERVSDKVVGYVAYMRLINGFEKYLYMSIEELQQHAEKYSQSYAYDQRSGKKSSTWSTNFDAMASKTVLKLLLSRWGILSSEMVDAINADQSVVDKNSFEYVDNGGHILKRESIYTSDGSIDVTPVDDTAGTPDDYSADSIQSGGSSVVVPF